MSRAVSIHVGVNQPQDRHAEPLRHSERTAWRMAELASQAGYESLLVLRGQAGTRQAVHNALAEAAQTLQLGDTLLVTFSGHGGQQRDYDTDERHGADESWCLYDGQLVDDKLSGYWRLFEPGVRIVVVSESCYSGGITRTGSPSAAWAATNGAARGFRRVTLRTPSTEPERAPTATAPSFAFAIEPPRDCCEIHASVLVLTASSEQQTAQDGLFTDQLLEIWDGGAFRGSYANLFQRVRERVMAEAGQEPQILMLGAPDPDFPLMPAFHRGHAGEPPRHRVYR